MADGIGGVSAVQSAVQVYAMKKAMGNQQTQVNALQKMLGGATETKIPVGDLGRRIDVKV